MKVNNTPPSPLEIPIKEYTLNKTHMLLFRHKQREIKGFLPEKMQFVQFRVIALITDTPTEIRFFGQKIPTPSIGMTKNSPTA